MKQKLSIIFAIACLALAAPAFAIDPQEEFQGMVSLPLYDAYHTTAPDFDTAAAQLKAEVADLLVEYPGTYKFHVSAQRRFLGGTNTVTPGCSGTSNSAVVKWVSDNVLATNDDAGFDAAIVAVKADYLAHVSAVPITSNQGYRLYLTFGYPAP